MQPHPRQIAAQLQARAPHGHMLAYINPREAAVLRSQGGSGVMHADTGIPRFDDGTEFDQQQPTFTPSIGEGGGLPPSTYGADFGGGGAPQFGPGMSEPSYGGGFNFQAPDFGGGAAPANFGATDFVAPTAQPAPPVDTSAAAALSPTGGFDPNVQGDSTNALDRQTGAPTPANQSAPTNPLAALTKGLDLGKLATAGITGILGARTARNAAAQGQQAKAETQRLAAPYQQLGTNLQAQAQRGELTPGGQQSIQAMRAQLAQGISNRGGVGVAQAENQIAAMRQKLLDEQMQLGLKISGIGDQIAIGAIQTGIQADQYVNSLTSNYFNNIARTLYGAGPSAAPATGP